MSSTGVSLAARLDLLERSAVISPHAHRLTLSTIRRIEESLGLTLGDENAGVLVTHVAMALSRIERGEPEPDIPDLVGEEIADRREERLLALALVAEWSAALQQPVPEAELSYLIVHLAVLHDNARWAGEAP